VWTLGLFKTEQTRLETSGTSAIPPEPATTFSPRRHRQPHQQVAGVATLHNLPLYPPEGWFAFSKHQAVRRLSYWPHTKHSAGEYEAAISGHGKSWVRIWAKRPTVGFHGPPTQMVYWTNAMKYRYDCSASRYSLHDQRMRV
jgi:hypothetical protein